ncbi:Na+/H+ antiporter NhaA [Sphingomonas sp.]|uniref:Na+/H+ antiporter NhaA n=1 Tax=Sphingomonas sp. TaxID=28214 RepID=UPI003B3A6458
MTTPTHPAKALQAFLRSETSGGILLIAAAALALLVANSGLAPSYQHALHVEIAGMSVLHWINDGLMALFFLLVGLEIKREFLVGHLASWSDRILPGLAALGGMIVPALLYMLIAGRTEGLARGWAIPCATDIAFALGVIAMLGKRVPVSLKVFLTTVAIVDDMGAVAIIALVYTAGIKLVPLLAALAVIAVMALLNRSGVMRLWPYLICAVLLWAAVLSSGVHATVAGVIAAMMIPVCAEEESCPLRQLEHALHPWSAFLIVPLFGFANAGVSFTGMTWADIVSPLPLAVAAGLFIGKQIGVLGSVWLAVRSPLATKPEGASWPQIYGVALLCGVGFTMSLFIGGLAFDQPLLIDEVKIGVLAGSLISALAGYGLLRMTTSRP